MVSLPVGEKDTRKRLHILDKEYNEFRTSTVPFSVFYMIPLMGGLFRCIVKQLFHSRMTTGIVSNIPGPSHFFMFGEELDEIICSTGLAEGDFALGLLSYSFKDSWSYGIGVLDYIMSEKDVEFFIRRVDQEFEVLKKLTPIIPKNELEQKV